MNSLLQLGNSTQIGWYYYVDPTIVPSVYYRADIGEYSSGQSVFSDIISIFQDREKEIMSYRGTLEDEDGIFWATRAGEEISVAFANQTHAILWLENPLLCPFCPVEGGIEEVGEDLVGNPTMIDGIPCCLLCATVYDLAGYHHDIAMPVLELDVIE